MVNPLKHHFKSFCSTEVSMNASAPYVEMLIHDFPQHLATQIHTTFQCLQQQQHSMGNHSPISKTRLLQRWSKPRQTGLFILIPTDPRIKCAHLKSGEKREQLSSLAVCLKRVNLHDWNWEETLNWQILIWIFLNFFTLFASEWRLL